MRRLEHGHAEPGVVSAAPAAVRGLAALEQVAAFEDWLAEIERAAGIGQGA